MGKRLAEERMLEELQFLIELIKSFQGELECFYITLQSHCKDLRVALEDKYRRFGPFPGGPFRLRLLNAAPTNITFAMLFGRRFDYGDPTFVTLLRLIDEVMLLLGSPFLHVSHPPVLSVIDV